MLTLCCSCIAVDRWHCDTCRCQGQTGRHGQVHCDAEKPLWRGNINRQRQRPWWVDRFLSFFLWTGLSVLLFLANIWNRTRSTVLGQNQHTREIHMPTTHQLRVTVGDSHTCQPIQFTGIKHSFFITMGGYGHIGKWITSFSWDFKLSKKIEKLSNEQLTHAITKCTLTGLVE